MKVKDFIERLKHIDPETEVVLGEKNYVFLPAKMKVDQLEKLTYLDDNGNKLTSFIINPDKASDFFEPNEKSIVQVVIITGES